MEPLSYPKCNEDHRLVSETPETYPPKVSSHPFHLDEMRPVV
jgi:hypothetical protein